MHRPHTHIKYYMYNIYVYIVLYCIYLLYITYNIYNIDFIITAVLQFKLQYSLNWIVNLISIKLKSDFKTFYYTMIASWHEIW